MGLFDKIKKAIGDSGLVDATKSAIKNLAELKENKGASETANSRTRELESKYNIPVEQREPELAEFYDLFVQSVTCKKEEIAKAKGLEAINAFINAYTPRLQFLSDSIKSYIWYYTKNEGIACDYTPKNDEDKNLLLHFIYSMKNIDECKDYEEKVLYLWEHAKEIRNIDFDNDMLYTNDLFSKSLKKFKLNIDYFPSDRWIRDKEFFKCTSCEYGDCVVCKDDYKEELFCTCDDSVSCDEKDDYPLGNLWDEELLPILRARAISKTGNDWDKRERVEVRTAALILDTYAHDLKNDKFIEIVRKSVAVSGVIKSPVVRYLAKLNRDDFEINLDKILQYIKVAEMISQEYTLNVEEADWLSNPSLYEKDNLTYVVRAFLTFSNKKWVKEHMLNPDIIDLDEFYNEDGTIKDAGGEDIEGDTIWNTVERWADGNENEETFAEDKRQREEKKKAAEEHKKRLEMCNKCQHHFTCGSVGKVEVCPQFLPYNW